MRGSLESPLAVYVHWPFCRSKCPYCDFNSVARDLADQGPWRDALLRELRHFAGETGGRTVASVFFGGGTPSLMEPSTVAAVIEAVGADWRLADGIEITLEANPTSSEAARFEGVRAAGVNRLSLGVQSFDDRALAFLGRTHDSAEARRALESAAAVFPRVSLDLITARPGQTVDAWRAELAEALAFGTGHLSIYQLTVEPGTRFFEDGVAAADEDTAADLFEATQDVLGAAGLPAYEISNHARPGDECRHNLATWRGEDYLGIGPGAHGRVTALGRTDAVRQIADPAQWLDTVQRLGHGTAARSRLSHRERTVELVLMGLRTREGLSRARFRRLTGRAVETVLNPEALTRLTAAGLLEDGETALRATDAGRLRLNAVIATLL